MTELSSLWSEHGQIGRLLHELSRLVMRPLPPHRPELERIRRDFTMSVGRHLKHEDAIVYPRLLQSEAPEVRAVARRLIAESGTLAAKFDTYCQRWNGSAIVADWSGFRYATSELLGLIERRIAAEQFELYPLLETEQDGAVGRLSRWSGIASPSHARLQLLSAPARARR